MPLLTKLHDVHPGSMPNTFTGTDDGSVLYLGEGGQVSIIDLTTTPPATGPGLMPSAVKKVQVGKLGVVPADLLLDPTLCFTEDDDLDGDAKNDCSDLLIVAGGHMGLWVMSANPTLGQPNRVMRIDDQQDTSQPQSVQDSVRFCNQLAIVTVGPKRLLAATFGAKHDSRLRLYDLDLIHALFASWAPETGAEIDPMLEVTLGARTLVAASISPQTADASYVLGLTVDQEQAVLPKDESADVYLAMNTNGLLRVRLDPVIVPGSNPPQLASIQFATDWGPVFGTGTPYATPGSGAYGAYDPTRYENLHLYVPTRSVRFDELARFDPPAFTDTVVQDDGGGHYLYAAVDHLNWVRFDLLNPWSDAMVIDHHEGADQVVNPSIVWSGQPQASSWAGRKHVKPTNFDPLVAMWLYARRLVLVDPPLGCGVVGPALIVTYGALPWAQLSDVIAPRPTYENDFDVVGGVSLGTGHVIGAHQVATVLYDAGQLIPHYPGAAGNELGYMQAGGGALWAPPIQDPARSGGVNTLMVLHDGVSYIHSTILQMESNGVCLSYFDLLTGQTGLPGKFYQRDEAEMEGRYTFSIGWSEADPRVLFLGANDNGEIYHDGALWTRLQSNGEWVIERSNYNPQPPQGDRRMILGLRPQEDCEWAGDPNLNQAWFIGRAEEPPVTPQAQPTIRWELFDYRIASLPTPTATLEKMWFIDSSMDRWERTGRPGGYDVATTCSEAYSAWVQSNYTSAVAANLAFYVRAGTADKVEVVDRDGLVSRLSPLPHGASSIHAWNPNWAITRLNCHPEYDPMPNDLGDAAYSSSRDWWSVTGPPMTEQAASQAWHPDTIHFPDRGPGKPERWLLGVPCHFLTHAPTLAAAELAESASLDTAFTAWFNLNAPNFPAESLDLINSYGHGLVQFWEISDPDHIQFQQTGAGTPQPFGYPFGSSTLPKIVFDEPASAAWDIEALSVATNEGLRVLLVCTDFGGEVLVYDITDLPEGVLPGAPDARWSPPERDLDDLQYFEPGALNTPRRAVNDLWSVAVDQPEGTQVRMYAATHEHGIFALTLDNVGVSVADLEFLPQLEKRIETSGTPFRVRIRPAGAHGPKALLVTDAMGGLRVYGEDGP
ncbi:MAG: hypothetical protein R3F49_24205 [Planctomycetota bacterium]